MWYVSITFCNENAWALTRPPATCPLCQYSCRSVVKWCQDVAQWRHDVTPWCNTTSYVITKRFCPIYTGHTIKMSENHFFQNGDLDLWPMTLTFELIQDIVKVNPSTKFWVRIFNGSAGRALTNEHTHTQTHGTDFIPSTADAGGKKKTHRRCQNYDTNHVRDMGCN